MEYLKGILKGVSMADSRSALYYVSRYIKQAAYFDERSKDIFDDEDRSVPSTKVKKLTLRIIASIEKAEKKKASKFSDRRVSKILDQITEFESTLNPEFSDSELSEARMFMKKISLPRVTRR